MRLGAHGLRDVKTDDLRALLRALHREQLPCPIDRKGLATVGLLRIADDVAILRGLDAAAVRAVVVSVLAERT